MGGAPTTGLPITSVFHIPIMVQTSSMTPQVIAHYHDGSSQTLLPLAHHPPIDQSLPTRIKASFVSIVNGDREIIIEPPVHECSDVE